MIFGAPCTCVHVNDARVAAAAAASEVAREWRVWEVLESFLLESQVDVGSKDDRWQTGESLAAFVDGGGDISLKWSFEQTASDLQQRYAYVDRWKKHSWGELGVFLPSLNMLVAVCNGMWAVKLGWN